MGAGRRTVHDAGERCAALPEMLLDAVEAVGRGEVGTADRYRQLFLRGARQQLLCRFLVADVVCDHPCSAAREALGDGSPDTALLRCDQCSRRTARATGCDLTNWERCLSIGRNEAQPTRNLP